METLIKDLENLKTGEKYHDFVIDDAVMNMQKTQEALEDPENWYKNVEFSTKTFLKAFPIIYFIQQQQLAEANDAK